MMNFDDFEWHDSCIEEIRIDRRNPGHIDSILFRIASVDDKVYNVLFSDVFCARLNMNMGVIACESIDFAYSREEHALLQEVRSRWNVGDANAPRLHYFLIVTSSTGSCLEIVAEKVEILHLPMEKPTLITEPEADADAVALPPCSKNTVAAKELAEKFYFPWKKKLH